MRVGKIVKYSLLLLIVAVGAAVFLLMRMDFSSYRPLVAEKVREATGRDFEIAGALKLDISFTPAIVVEDIRLQNAIFGSRAEMIKARRLEAEVALLPLLLGRIEIKRLALIGPDILLETDEQGRSNWDFHSDDEPANVARPASAEAAALDLPNLDAVTIESGLLTYRNGMTGRSMKLEVVHFTGWSDSRMAPLNVELTAAYDGIPFHVNGRLGAFVALGSPRPFPVDLNADMTDVQLAIKGTVTRPMSPTAADFAIEASAGSLRNLASAFKLALPGGAVNLSTHATFKDKQLNLADLKATLGGSDLAGQAAVDLTKQRPQITATLAGQRLDLADLTPESNGDSAKTKAKTKPGAGDRRLFSAEPLPLDMLRAADGRIEAKFDRLALGRVALDQAAVTAVLQDGQLTLEPVSGILAQGQMTGSLALAAGDGGQAKLDLHIAKLNAKALAQAFDAGDILTGDVDVQATVAGRGESPRALMASLGGKASVVMGKGEVKSSYVDLLGADLLRFAAGAATSGSGGSQATAMNCLVGRFDIAKGLASSHDILFDTNKMTVKGEGSINLANERLALKFTPRPKDMSLVNLATPWRVEGSLNAPQVSLDEVGAAKLAAGTLLSVVNPLALLVPLVTSTGNDKNPCLAALEAPSQNRGQTPKTESGGIGGLLDRVIPGR